MLTVNCKFWGRLGGLILFLLLGFRPADAAVFDWRDKVDPWVLETAVPQPTPDSSDSSEALPQTEFLVFLTAQADLSGAAQQPDRLAKGQYVYEQLTTLAGQTQTAVLNQLDDLGAAYEPFWIANMIWVRSNIGVIEAMARRSDVAHLYANPQVALDVIPPPPIETDFSQTAVAGVEWNVDHINAPDLWAAGHTGQGVVIGGQDTGYEWEHPALINAYRGWDGGSADHNYNWHDAIHSTAGTNICGSDSPEPCDDFSSSHGTHTMGIMTGNDLAPDDPGWPAAATNAVGVAPGAQWIGCRNMDNGSGTPASYSECYQWFLAPTDLDGNNPNPALAPHVINNSWSCPPSEGCTPDALLTVVDSVRAAGIVTVHAAGNSGPSCSSIDTPAAIYDSSLTVGNTGSSDTINSTSSRGPVTVDGSGRLKPDVVAPGTGIRSTVRNDGYGILTGTSMAAPHVAGLVALLISADPDLAGDVDAIETLIGQTAVPLTTTQGCGDTATAVPNNVYGYGRVDAFPIFIDLLEEELYIPLLLKP